MNSGFERNKESLGGSHNSISGQKHNANIRQNSNNGGLVEIDGFDISKIPEHLTVQDSVWAGNNRTKPTLLKIGDITVPELRRRLMLKRQQVLNKNKYYVQQKVLFLWNTPSRDSYFKFHNSSVFTNLCLSIFLFRS